jgi:hypothetical protein
MRSSTIVRQVASEFSVVDPEKPIRHAYILTKLAVFGSGISPKSRPAT